MLFAPDPSFPVLVQPGLGYRKGVLPERASKPVAIVIHTCGAGIIRKWQKTGKKHNETTPFQTAFRRVYARQMKASGNYTLGQQGEIGQCVPEYLCAWHVGSAKSRPYFSDDRMAWAKRRGHWWLLRHAPLLNPCDLAGGELWKPYRGFPGLSTGARAPASWRRGSVNANTIGIEVVPPQNQPTGEWSNACWTSLVRLVLDLSERHEIPLTATHVLTHSDAHPLARTRGKGARARPWDTGSAQFTFDEFARRAGVVA